MILWYCVFSFLIYGLVKHTFSKRLIVLISKTKLTECLFLSSKTKKFFVVINKKYCVPMLFSNSQVWKFTRETTVIQSMFFAHSIPHHQTYIFHKWCWWVLDHYWAPVTKVLGSRLMAGCDFSRVNSIKIFHVAKSYS